MIDTQRDDNARAAYARDLASQSHTFAHLLIRPPTVFTAWNWLCSFFFFSFLFLFSGYTKAKPTKKKKLIPGFTTGVYLHKVTLNS